MNVKEMVQACKQVIVENNLQISEAVNCITNAQAEQYYDIAHGISWPVALLMIGLFVLGVFLALFFYPDNNPVNEILGGLGSLLILGTVLLGTLNTCVYLSTNSVGRVGKIHAGKEMFVRSVKREYCQSPDMPADKILEQC